MKIGVRPFMLGIGVMVAFLGFAKPNLPISVQGLPLIEAAVQNDLALVQRLLKQGAEINAQDARGRTALLAAVEGNHLENAEALIEAGANVNVQDHKMDSPLLLAGAEGTLDILKLILQAKPDFSLYNRFGGTP